MADIDLETLTPTTPGPSDVAVVRRGAGPYSVELVEMARSYLGAPHMMLPAAGLYLGNLVTGTLTTGASSANRQQITPFLSPYSVDIDQVGVSVSTAASGTSVCVLVFDADANGRPGALLLQSPDMSAGTAATVTTAVTLSLEAGKVYWIGTWTSGAPALRCGQAYSSFNLNWTNAATPVKQGMLVRNETWGGTSSDWTYASGNHSSGNVPLVLLRVA